MRVLAAGHVCVDLVPALDAVPAESPGALVPVGGLGMRLGGCVANAGTALADLGAEVAIAADVGADELGEVVRRLARARFGTDAGLAVAPDTGTSYSIVIEPPGHDRTFWHHAGANRAFDGDGLDLAGLDAIHLGYPPLLPALVADAGAPLARLLARAHAAGVLTSLDLAVMDPRLETAGTDWDAVHRRAAPDLDVLSPSADDLASMGLARSGASWDDLAAVAGRLVESGVAVVAITDGSRGMVLRAAGRERLARHGVLARIADAWADVEVRAPAPMVRVRTTLGAGDAASAGLLFGILSGLSPADAASLALSAAARRVCGADPLPAWSAGAGGPYARLPGIVERRVARG